MLTIITIIKISPNIHDNNPSSQRGCGFETGLRRDEVASTFTVIIVILIISIIIMKPEYISNGSYFVKRYITVKRYINM